MSSPVIFAHKVIHQIAKQCVPSASSMTLDDYLALRIAFRSLGGQWQALAQGDIQHMKLLKDVVKEWGKQHAEKKTTGLI